MFRPTPMLRLNLIALARDERQMLLYLGQQGVLHLTHDPITPNAETSEKLAHCAGLLARCEKLRHSLDISHMSRSATPAVNFGIAAISITQLETQTTALLALRQRLLARQTELGSLCDRAAKYRGLDLPLDRLDRSSFLHFVIGTLPADNLETLRDKLGASVVLLPAPQKESRQAVILMTTPRRLPALEPLLHELDFQGESLSAPEGVNADTLFKQSLKDQEQVAAELDQVDHKIISFSASTANLLAAIENEVECERRLLEASQSFARTQSSVLLSGWIPESDAPPLVAGVKALTNGQCVIETSKPDPTTSDPVPILLRSSRWLRPFSRLVAAYGLPEYWELEPTLFVAISYIVMFGMMFGDAGQGAILALGGLGALWAGHSSKTQDAGLVLLLGGLSSIVFGILYGSYFGIPWLKSFALWRDPLEGDPMQLLVAAVGMGVVVVSLGLVLNIINRFRQHDALGGILGRFGIAGLLFYWGALTLLAKYATLRAHGLMTAALILFLALPMAGWIIKAPIERVLRRKLAVGDEVTTARVAPRPPENLGGEGRVPPRPDVFLEVLESIIGAFEGALMYLANTTSFVRLAAYAMSHAALLMAVFTVANSLKHSIPLGSAWGVVVVILGNAVAIVLEGTIAAVQALRLEYYEFFGKFFSGTGQPFTPFRLPIGI